MARIATNTLLHKAKKAKKTIYQTEVEFEKSRI